VVLLLLLVAAVGSYASSLYEYTLNSTSDTAVHGSASATARTVAGSSGGGLGARMPRPPLRRLLLRRWLVLLLLLPPTGGGDSTDLLAPLSKPVGLAGPPMRTSAVADDDATPAEKLLSLPRVELKWWWRW
jgi:hypothetical protein